MASAVHDLETAPLIAVDEHGVQLNGASTANLSDDLVTLRRNFALLHPSENFSGTVLLLADRELGFERLKSVLSACQAAGYAHASLVVTSKG